MELRQAFAAALKAARKSKNLTQEDFANVSSRTYISTLERGGNSPTLEKVDRLAETIGVHPLSILFMTYMGREGCSDEDLFRRLQVEIQQINAVQMSDEYAEKLGATGVDPRIPR